MYLKQIFAAESESRNLPTCLDTLPAFLQGVYTRKLQVLALAELNQNGEKTVQLNQNQKIS